MCRLYKGDQHFYYLQSLVANHSMNGVGLDRVLSLAVQHFSLCPAHKVSVPAGFPVLVPGNCYVVSTKPRTESQQPETAIRPSGGESRIVGLYDNS